MGQQVVLLGIPQFADQWKRWELGLDLVEKLEFVANLVPVPGADGLVILAHRGDQCAPGAELGNQIRNLGHQEHDHETCAEYRQKQLAVLAKKPVHLVTTVPMGRSQVFTGPRAAPVGSSIEFDDQVRVHFEWNLISCRRSCDIGRQLCRRKIDPVGDDVSGQ